MIIRVVTDCLSRSARRLPGFSLPSLLLFPLYPANKYLVITHEETGPEKINSLALMKLLFHWGRGEGRAEDPNE